MEIDFKNKEKELKYNEIIENWIVNRLDLFGLS